MMKSIALLITLAMLFSSTCRTNFQKVAVSVLNEVKTELTHLKNDSKAFLSVNQENQNLSIKYKTTLSKDLAQEIGVDEHLELYEVKATLSAFL